MPDQSQGERQKKAADNQKTADQPPPSTYAAPPIAEQPASATTAKGKPAVKLGELTVTAGTNGARNIAIQWIDVWVENAKPVRFNVKTLAENSLEVVVEQAAYKRNYAGTGTVATQTVPVVPVGTRGVILVRDTTTGESARQAWLWTGEGPGLFAWLIGVMKNLIWK
jgi:hypothetical protein